MARPTGRGGQWQLTQPGPISTGIRNQRLNDDRTHSYYF